MSPFEQLVFFSNEVAISNAGRLVEGADQWLHAARELMRQTHVEIPCYNNSSFDAHMDHIRSLRQLSRGLQQACCESQADNDLDRVVYYAVGLFDLSRVICCGRLLLDMLISVDIVSAAIDEVRAVRRQISSAARQTLIEATERFERESDSIEVIIDRDRKWDIENADPDETESAVFSSACLEYDQDPESSSCEETMAAKIFNDLIEQPRANQVSLHATLYHRSLALVRILRSDLAIRSFHEEKSRYPDRLDDLVPGNLAEVPMDPFTSRPLCYQNCDTEEFAVYSIGPCQIDHGGTFGSWLEVAAGNADLGLDLRDYLTS